MLGSSQFEKYPDSASLLSVNECNPRRNKASRTPSRNVFEGRDIAVQDDASQD